MVGLSIPSVLSLAALLPVSLALPHFWPHGYSEKPYPILTVSSSEGIYPTGASGTTGTGTGTGTGSISYPTASGSTYNHKREADPPYGYPPPYPFPPSGSGFPTGFPTASMPPMPTGTAPSASGTGIPYPTPAMLDKRAVNAAKQALRQQVEGPRRRDIKPYYPYAPGEGYGPAEPTAPASTGTGVVPTGGTAVLPTGATGFPTAPAVYPYPTFIGY